MAEWRLYPHTDTPPVSTEAFHADRSRAPHLEQEGHRERLIRAADFVLEAADLVRRYHELGPGEVEVSDLGCGDGGLLSLIKDSPQILHVWGYDFQPSNREGWVERDVPVVLMDVFSVIPNPDVALGDVVVMTEVLEHLANPHAALDWISRTRSVDAIVASSPWAETDRHHDECHAWAWDQEGFRALFESRGWVLERQEIVSGAQVVLAVRPGLVRPGLVRADDV